MNAYLLLAVYRSPYSMYPVHHAREQTESASYDGWAVMVAYTDWHMGPVRCTESPELNLDLRAEFIRMIPAFAAAYVRLQCTRGKVSAPRTVVVCVNVGRGEWRMPPRLLCCSARCRNRWSLYVPCVRCVAALAAGGRVSPRRTRTPFVDSHSTALWCSRS